MPTPLGAKVKKLIAYRMAVEAIPIGQGLEAGVRFLTTPGALANGWHTAADWTRQAIQAVRFAAEPNPWKNASDEDIAAEILRNIDARRSAASQKTQ